MKKGHSILRKVGKAILWIVMAFFIIITIATLLLKLSSVQLMVGDYAASFLSRKTGTIVDIKKIRISVFKSLTIENLYLADTKKDTLIFIDQAKAEISVTDLLRKELNITSVNLDNALIKLRNEETDSLFNYNFLVTAFADTTVNEQKTENKSPWSINIGQIILSDIQIRYDDFYNGKNASVSLNHLQLKMDTTNLDRLYFKAQALMVEGLKTILRLSNDSTGKNTVLSADIKAFNLINLAADLKDKVFAAKELDLSESGVIFKTDDTDSQFSKIKSESGLGEFDINHLEYTGLTLSVKDLYYSATRAEATVNNFTATDRNDFSITQFETFFKMDQHSITAENLIIKTPNSSVEADLKASYPSFALLKDSAQVDSLNINLKQITVRNSDITYFNPGLRTLDFFKNADNITNVSGMISGPLNNLSGINLLITTLGNTRLSSDFTVTGLPAVKSAFFDIPSLKIETVREDIKMIASSSIPQNIELPDEISIDASLKGSIRSFESNVSLSSTYGSAQFSIMLDKNENYTSNIEISGFDLGSLLKNKMFGRFSLAAEADGYGLNKDSVNAKINVEISEIWLNKYLYHNLTVNGTISGRQYTGSIILDDENAAFDFNGLADLSEGSEYYDLNLNLLGADLLKLNLTKDNIGVGFILNSEIRGGSFKEMSGKVGIYNIMIAREGETYVLDSMNLALVNEPGKSELNINSQLFDLTYNGTISPDKLANVPFEFINNYFSFKSPDSIDTKKTGEIQNFDFEILLHDNLPLREAFFPQVKEFLPGLITGSYNSEKNTLDFSAEMERIVYGTTEINNLTIDIDSDEDALDFRIFASTISNSQISLDNFLFEGEMSDNTITSNLSSIDDDKNVKLKIRSQVTIENDNYKFSIIPQDFYLMSNRWDISEGNYVLLGKQGFLIHDLSLSREDRQINIASVNDKFKDDLNIAISNFNLDDISGIIQRDTSLVKGKIDGNILLKRINDTYGLIADVRVENLSVGEVAIGSLTLLAENPATDRFDIDARLTGEENDLTISGYFITQGEENSLNIEAGIQSLSLKTVEVLSMGAIKEASGNITGDLSIIGSSNSPVITGTLVFNDAYVTPAALNNQLHLVQETVQIKEDGIYFDSFQILDSNQNTASIDGSVKMDNFRDFVFALQVNANDFLLFNTTSADNKNFFGKLLIDTQLEVTGPMSLPVVNAKLKMKEGSNFTFSVSEKKLTADRGDGVVEFENLSQSNPILSDQKENQTSGLTGFDITSVIEIDEQATLRVLLDPSTADSLVVRGSAALSFTIDPSGKMSLTGSYNVKEGSYQVSLESLVKRKFDIKSGSTITWNGDPMDADISIDAIYSVRAAPIDLVADQLSGLSEMDQNTYKQRYPFEVLLKLRGAILNPEISFEIQLLPEDKGIFGGSVNAKLNMLSEDPSALNKQVFALLILGRFVQENPFETDAASSAVRSTVGRFLSDQLNQWSSRLVPGVELSFDVQSYNDYQSGEAEGRTQLDVGVKKQLFNERLSVQVEGIVDVEGEAAKQNSANDITSNVTIEYKLTEDGRLRLKGFRHNTYEGAIEGQIVETGAGIIYVREFNRWKEFIRKKRKE